MSDFNKIITEKYFYAFWPDFFARRCLFLRLAIIFYSSRIYNYSADAQKSAVYRLIIASIKYILLHYPITCRRVRRKSDGNRFPFPKPDHCQSLFTIIIRVCRKIEGTMRVTKSKFRHVRDNSR